MNKQYYVYILSNKTGSVLYTVVTSNLKRRVFEHKNKLVEGFTSKYNADRLVYFDICSGIEGAITEEKRIKGGSRQDKLNLVSSFNKDWRDLLEEI